jgi:PAS domain S-box-containing protein
LKSIQPDKEFFLSASRIIIWGFVYYLVALFSLSYFLTPDGIAIAWPPMGVYISALLLSKKNERPLIVIVLFIADFLADLHVDISTTSRIFYAFTSTGDAVISSWLLLKFAENPFNFNKARNLFRYLLFSVLLCNGFFSTLVGLYTSFISSSGILQSVMFSWVADSVGNLMIVPLIISWSTTSKNVGEYLKFSRAMELAILIISLFVLNLVLFPYHDDGILFSFIINYLSFPFIIWAIFRFETRIVTLVMLLLTSVMLFNLRIDKSLVSNYSLGSYTFFQLYIASIAIISLIITIIKSERNQAYIDLKESEKKYRTVADYTYTWEYWKDPAGNILYMSPSVERVTGYTAENFKSNPELLNEIVFEEDRDQWEEHKRKMQNCETGTQSEVEFRIISKDGKLHWICHDCRQISNEGIDLGIRVSNRDITSLVEAEKKLLYHTAEIEERERNRYSRELHDGLGPLLSTIKLYVQSLSDAMEPERIRFISEKSNDSIKLALQTMREIAHGLSPSNLHNSGYVGAVTDFIDGINKLKKIAIDFTYNEDSRFNDFYEIVLYRITTELITNTLKHADAARATIEFNYDTEKGNIHLCYTDNGKGFDMEQTGENGNGMGLMNIRQRVKLLGGKMLIETANGKGTRFLMDLSVSSTYAPSGRNLN